MKNKLTQSILVSGFHNSGKSTMALTIATGLSKSNIGFLLDQDELPEIILNHESAQVLVDKSVVKINQSIFCVFEEELVEKYIVSSKTPFEYFVFINNRFESTLMLDILQTIDEGPLSVLADKITVSNVITLLDCSTIIKNLKSTDTLKDRFPEDFVEVDDEEEEEKEKEDDCCASGKCTNEEEEKKGCCQVQCSRDAEEKCCVDGKCKNVEKGCCQVKCSKDAEEKCCVDGVCKNLEKGCCDDGKCTKEEEKKDDCCADGKCTKEEEKKDDCCVDGKCNKEEKKDDCCVDGECKNEEESGCCDHDHDHHHDHHHEDEEELESKGDTSISSLVVEQIIASGLIILNRADITSPKDVAFIEKLVNLISPSSKVLLSTACSITNIFGNNRQTLNVKDHEIISTSHQGVCITNFYQRTPFHPNRFYNFIFTNDQAMNMDTLTGLIDLRGSIWIATDMDQSYEIVTTRKDFALMPGHPFFAGIPVKEWPQEPSIIESIKRDISLFTYQDRKIELSIIGDSDASFNQEKFVNGLKSCLLTKEEMELGPNGWAEFKDPLIELIGQEDFEEEEEEEEADN